VARRREDDNVEKNEETMGHSCSKYAES
jgi:hypothetical protein